jgi:hypothetical protein
VFDRTDSDQKSKTNLCDACCSDREDSASTKPLTVVLSVDFTCHDRTSSRVGAVRAQQEAAGLTLEQALLKQKPKTGRRSSAEVLEMDASSGVPL